MIREIRHRGPDDEQIHVDGPFGTAFCRLSIVDLEGGRQPFVSPDGSLVLVANGEIYNHRELRGRLREKHQFQSDSDCEILLHLYAERGLDLLDDVIGMYGFALWDRRQGRLLLARDRLGIKPLYYALIGNHLIFGSEIKALLRHPECPRDFDWRHALTDPWLVGEIATASTDVVSYFEGIECLPGGHMVIADLRRGSVDRRQYWSLPSPAEVDADPRSDRELVAEYGALVEDSVEKCLMSDVEYGLFLSGGIDSVGIAAIAAAKGTFHTFTVLSQSTFANEDARYAHVAASRLGLSNHQVLFDWHESMFSPEQWRALVWLCETPYCGPEQLYKFQLHRYAKSARPQLKVMLLGQGSDEFNGGYSTLLAPPEDQSWTGFLESLTALSHGGLLRAGDARLKSWEDRFMRPLFSDDYLASLCSAAPETDPWSSYERTKFRDLQSYNLWHEDRTAAGNSIENRVPYLDHRIVEFAMRLPRERHPSLLWDKTILRHALSGRLSEELRHRPKVPFFHGSDVRFTHRMMAGILEAEGRALLEQITSGAGRAADIFDRDVLHGILDDVAADPEAQNAEFLLRLVNMGLLEQMARELRPASDALDTLPVPEVVAIESWEASEEQLRLSLGGRREIDLDGVLTFAPGVYLVKKDTAVDAPAESYLVVNERVEFVLTEEAASAWLQVLRVVDGQLTAREAIVAAGVSEAEVRKHLEEALDFGIVELASRAGADL